MNIANPFRAEIEAAGLTSEDFFRVFGGPGNQTIQKTGRSIPVSAWLPRDPSILAYLSAFMQTGEDRIIANEANTAVDMLGHVLLDVNAIGFCRLSDLRKLAGSDMHDKIRIIPVDINANQVLDASENIYASSADFEHGIWIGKYPAVLCSRVYAVSDSQPVEEAELALLGWLTSEGQKYVEKSGLMGLTFQEQQASINLLKTTPAIPSPAMTPPASIIPSLVVIVIVLAAGLLLLLFLRVFRDRSGVEEFSKVSGKKAFGPDSVAVPGGLFFDRTHTWAFMEKEGYVRTGIDDFLPRVTGTVTRIKMHSTGDIVRRGEVFLSLIQNGKQLDILSPVSGTIIENNKKLVSASFLINSDPLNGGWVYRIEPMNWLKETKAFLMGQGYREWIHTEFIRLKDFISSAVRSGNALIILQEGGEMKEGILEDLGPDLWEEFQSQFINLSR